MTAALLFTVALAAERSEEQDSSTLVAEIGRLTGRLQTIADETSNLGRLLAEIETGAHGPAMGGAGAAGATVSPMRRLSGDGDGPPASFTNRWHGSMLHQLEGEVATAMLGSGAFPKFKR